ncbi:23S rRNA (adenine(2503)-C(2))-methyltransferase RlmN [Proteiniborus sp. MB09-C3]|uniref:23S rRNA (adenine(2503)-C(2))-methyltransferase RlmN n=1 Tax=Proteiniborus sp. MB09-C3 TaxID=3050072 RepID=UPI0025578DEA|nr:23S rRNA (adenine(2503)-C(2))-methyltransferase RlmN [Proteiniborus sp. MB09-C3]WIV10804.1 23S rRNA (adenine(2503)-C(2))-methyltransferase RlmN [Proteiniborus sp. MB09-C3]
MNNIDLRSLEIEELEEVFSNLGEKKYRAHQTFKWIHQKMVSCIDDITELPQGLRDKLNSDFLISKLKIAERLDSKHDDTSKYLFVLDDGNIIESVMMKYKHGISVCLSTQVGCRMGCKFCASTKSGLVRNLLPGEILEQFYEIQKDQGISISNIVLMGSGEPLDNYDNVMKFLKIIHDKDGQNLGYRHITISTCGIVPRIYDLAEEGIPINLSISLHSPFDEERKNIMPIANRYSLHEIMEACNYYIAKTNRRITFEYTLIYDVNDRPEDALEIIKLLKNMLCHVNLIPLNNIKEFTHTKSDEKSIQSFKDILIKNGVNTTIRREMGADVNAACGQLRRDYLNRKKS